MQALQQHQRSLFNEYELYHDIDRAGFFSLLYPVNGIKRQRSYKLSDMPKVIDLLDKTRDTWISQAEFTKANRRIVNLWRLGLLFCDLDTYSTSIDSSNPEKTAYNLANYCREEGIPEPSLILFSGRGLQAKWLLDKTIPRKALPRWNACQRVLVHQLKEFGSDPNARDASRVLRLEGAVNSKSGEIARVVYINEENGLPLRHNFENLCEWLLPVGRDQIQFRKKSRQERKQQLKVINGGRDTSALRGFSGRQLAWHRLEDLRELADLRGGYKEGERMLHLFWQLNFLLLSGATNSKQMWHEAKALATAIDSGWHHDQSDLSTLYAKAKQFEAGETVDFNGKSYPALYTPRNDHLIDLFHITDDEQRKLKTIITPSISRERDAQRKRDRRRAAGAMDRTAYESNSLSNQKPWEQLGMSRATWYRQGKPEIIGK